MPFYHHATAIFIAILLIVSAIHGADQKKRAPARTWTSADGKFSLKASIVRVEAEQVVLRKLDGTEVTVPLKTLSTNDRLYAASVRDRPVGGKGESKVEPVAKPESDASEPWQSDFGVFVQLCNSAYKEHGNQIDRPPLQPGEIGAAGVTLDPPRFFAPFVGKRVKWVVTYRDLFQDPKSEANNNFTFEESEQWIAGMNGVEIRVPFPSAFLKGLSRFKSGQRIEISGTTACRVSFIQDPGKPVSFSTAAVIIQDAKFREAAASAEPPSSAPSTNDAPPESSAPTAVNPTLTLTEVRKDVTKHNGMRVRWYGQFSSVSGDAKGAVANYINNPKADTAFNYTFFACRFKSFDAAVIRSGYFIGTISGTNKVSTTITSANGVATQQAHEVPLLVDVTFSEK